ncbi:MAG: hypothetical protein LLG04_15655 [Parachlamydia sp.]|nr:hypothetical protein [Parachlamydia sp.]
MDISVFGLPPGVFLQNLGDFLNGLSILEETSLVQDDSLCFELQKFKHDFFGYLLPAVSTFNM